MQANQWLRVSSIVLMAALTSTAFGLAPLGPPTAGLNQGQFRLSGEYSYSAMDVELDPARHADGTITDLKSNMFFANLGYGLMDNWEAYVRVGVADAEFGKIDWDGDSEDERYGFDGDYGFAYGFGTKYTFWQQTDDLRWGALFQMTWMDTDGSADVVEETGEGTLLRDRDVELDYYEMQIAVGPTWQATDRVAVYGGPFLHFLSGDFDEEYRGYGIVDDALVLVDGPEKHSADLEEDSTFGGFIGAQFDLTEQAKVFTEVQFTGDAWGIGVGGGWWF
ncbi:MAG: hypothetical protein JW741_10925 [Sedimentisphaerales bacterium]|nr:hypothetical protein [Sedimentisphaerales bacterium]